MGIEVGSILDGKVTGITNFGAFVSLPGNRSGLVHISEIAYSYVNDVHDHLAEGQEVKVKVIGEQPHQPVHQAGGPAAPPPGAACRPPARGPQSPSPPGGGAPPGPQARSRTGRLRAGAGPAPGAGQL